MFERAGKGQPGGSQFWFNLFFEELKLYEHGLRLDSLLNQFLDLYSAWLKWRDPQIKQAAIACAQELMRLDPSFSCNIDHCFTEEATIHHAA